MRPEPLEVALWGDADLARMFGCSRRHLRRLVDRGAMPAPVRLGRLLRWRRSEIAEWIAAGCRPVRPGSGVGP